MKKCKVYSGIVTFNPNIVRLQKNIISIMESLNRIIIIDNDSKNISEIEEFVNKHKELVLIRNDSNKGIATALNQIIIWGRDNDYEWCLTMDQDSIPGKNMISLLISNILYYNNTAIVAPDIIDINQEAREINKNNVCKIVDSTKVITSGSLVSIEKALAVNGYDERLFIDYVDTDFQERLLREGFNITKVFGAKLFHEVGKIKKYTIFGHEILCTNHSPLRRYYQVRNRLYFRRKYFGKKSFYKEKIRLIMGTFKIIIFEKDALAKINSTIRGLRDYKDLLL